MTKIILDTSFLIEMVALGRNLLEIAEETLGLSLKPVMLPGVIEELERLGERGGLIGMRARGALRIAERFLRLDVDIKPGERVDDYVVRIAREFGLAVATNDSELRRKLRAEGVPHIYLRSDGGIGVYGELGDK